jgi:hypothetical protein
MSRLRKSLVNQSAHKNPNVKGHDVSSEFVFYFWNMTGHKGHNTGNFSQFPAHVWTPSSKQPGRCPLEGASLST